MVSARSLVAVSLLLLVAVFMIMLGLNINKPSEGLNSGLEKSCPMFRCNIYRTGNAEHLTIGSRAFINLTLHSLGSNLPEDNSSSISLSEFSPSSPMFIDLDNDGIDELIASYGNMLYNTTDKSRPYSPYVMSVKYKENPSKLERLEFGDVTYIREWYFAVPKEVHTSFSTADLNSDGAAEIVFGCDDGNLYVLDRFGKLYFKYNTGGEVRSTPATGDLDKDGFYEILFGSNDGIFYNLDHEGNLIWKFSSEAPIESSPAIFSRGNENYVAFGSDNGFLNILGKDGNLVCRFRTNGSIKSSPLPLGDTIIFGSDDGNIYMLDERCSLVASYATGGKVRSSASVFNDYGVIGSQDGHLYFFNQSAFMNISLGEPIYSTPVSLNGSILVSTHKGKVFVSDLNRTAIMRLGGPNYIDDCSPSIGNKVLFACTFYLLDESGFFHGIYIDTLQNRNNLNSLPALS